MKLIRPLAVTILLLLVLTQYQNCASNSPSTNANQNVRILNDLATQKVAFVEKQIELGDWAQDATINALCAGNSSLMNWSVTDVSGRAYEAATTVCEAGAFQVHLKKISSYPCGLSLFLLQSLIVSRRCPPLLARQVSRSEDGRDLCFLELESSPAVDASQIGSTSPRQCQQVCYRSGIVTLKRQMDEASCKDLNPSEL